MFVGLSRSILFAFGRRHKYYPRDALESGSIKLEIFPDQNSVNLSDTRAAKGFQSLIIDDGFEGLMHIGEPLFKELHKRLGCQIVATALVTLNKEMLAESQIISLNYPRYC